MSEHGTPAVKPADDPAFQLPASLSKLSLPLCIGGLVALVAAVLHRQHGVGAKFAMSAYLTAFIYCLTITIGCLFFVLIQHLCRAGWSIVVRRIAELIMIMVVPLAILFIPICWLASVAMVCCIAGTIRHMAISFTWMKRFGIPRQAGCLLAGLPFVRSFTLPSGQSRQSTISRGSVTQDETGEKAVTDRLQWWSGPAVVLFALTNFAGCV